MTSFAGQHDTYLNVVGAPRILQHVRRCWASLFSERAVTYGLRNGIDYRKIQMAIVLQSMVFPQVAGILFTADPVTGHRKVASIEASFGLGEALVSGLINPDVYKVQDGAVVRRAVASKLLAIHALPEEASTITPIEPERRKTAALTDAQAVRLAQLGRRIEAQFGSPQDIEWCLLDDEFQFVQSRPITTLFPIPAADDRENHIYLSVGHQQMMTDAMKPLGISVRQLTSARPMYEAGGRLFVDVTQDLASPASRARLLNFAGKSDPLMGDALESILERSDFVQQVSEQDPSGTAACKPPMHAAPASIETDPNIVTNLIARWEAALALAEHEIRTKSGLALLDSIQTDIRELQRILFDPMSHQVIMAGMEATWWLNDQLEMWLGEKSAADTLSQSVPYNVTSEMGLELLDVADAIRPHPDVVAFLENIRDDDFLDELPKLAGGREAHDAICEWLGKHGMRCVGEIDITRPRWSERPSSLVSLLLGNIKNFEPGAGKRRFEKGRQRARKKEEEVLQRLRALSDGDRKAEEVKGKIDRVRTFIGYREYPKYGMVSRYHLYKRALLREAERLVQTNVLRKQKDIFYLTFQELQEVARTNRVDDQLIRERKNAFETYESLTPPRVLTSDGEVLTGSYQRDDCPAGAFVGLPVSAGTVEGRARVILDMTEANLQPGDILVTTYTDPSWTPLFVAIKGLVTEVGGLMTHGAVIAREYGLPAIVGVENATRLIRDGQHIRVHGTDGYVQILA